jgi:ABC-type phosphate/phosphonate transport system permease subunit
MENEPRSLNYFSMMHGLYLGLAMIINQLIFYIIGIPFSDVSGYLSYVIILAGIGFAMWTYAKLNTEEGMSYSRALGLGTLVSLFASILVAFFSFILYKYIEPTLIDKMLATMEEKLLAQGWKDEAIETMLGAQKKYMTPGIMSFAQIFSITFMGFIFSLVLAIFFKKEPSNPFHEVEEEEEDED